ncbi:MAG: ligase-associated DNA damage response endonuclease PdeM [Leptolyngbya sp.]|nr:ligase-associated DNA damage response endonuclease PdeM [Candidatus Melainabacteria bacterium]
MTLVRTEGWLKFETQGEELTLLPQRAIYWESKKTLLVADVHFGKAATFRALNVAVPAGTTEKDLKTLSKMIGETGARKVIFLGDLVHNYRGLTDRVSSLLSAWREFHDDLEITLVRGNHDKKIPQIEQLLRLNIVAEPLIVPPFALKHHPEAEKEHYVLCGHTHPAVLLFGKARQKLRLPCFWFAKKVGTLPAFGSFTGCAVIEPEEGEHIFVIAENKVMEALG